jgi:DNA invertase Pin-like site-specific DNA recombinase
MKKPRKKITAFYCRSASKNRKLIKEQKDELIEYAKNHNIKNYKFYIDNGVSGATLERRAIKKLTADVEKRKIQTIAITHFNRLYRGVTPELFDKLPELFKIFRKHNVKFIDLTELKDSEYGEKPTIISKILQEK